MMVIIPLLWFIIITGSVVWALPRLTDTLLYFMDRRVKIWTKEVDLEERKNEIIKEQIRLQEIQHRRVLK